MPRSDMDIMADSWGPGTDEIAFGSPGFIPTRELCSCGHSRQSHKLGGECQYRATVFADIARDAPSGERCTCLLYGWAAPRGGFDSGGLTRYEPGSKRLQPVRADVLPLPGGGVKPSPSPIKPREPLVPPMPLPFPEKRAPIDFEEDV